MVWRLRSVMLLVLCTWVCEGGFAQSPGQSLTDAMLGQQTAYYSPTPQGTRGYYGPQSRPAAPSRSAMAAPAMGAYHGSSPSSVNSYYAAPTYRLAQAPPLAPTPAPALQPRPAAPAPTPAPIPAAPINGGAVQGAPVADGHWAGDYADGYPCGGRRAGPGAGGGWGFDMPQHYVYYPPMHGYYYFHPYHYTHVPAQQAFTSQFGVDTRNPYSNDFFKVVYAEYRSSLIHPASEPIGTPVPESPTDTIKKLKTLNDEGILSDEEFEAKKAEILQRM